MMSHPMMFIQADTLKYYGEERRRKTGHYKQERIIIGPSGSRTAATEVSINPLDQTVPPLLTTYMNLVI